MNRSRTSNTNSDSVVDGRCYKGGVAVLERLYGQDLGVQVQLARRSSTTQKSFTAVESDALVDPLRSSGSVISKLQDYNSN